MRGSNCRPGARRAAPSAARLRQACARICSPGRTPLFLWPATQSRAAPATFHAADVLLQFAAAARGANAAALADWRNGTDPCTWTGVSCMGTTVASLHLPRARLQGSLAAELSQLTSLQQMCVCVGGGGGAAGGRRPGTPRCSDSAPPLPLPSRPDPSNLADNDLVGRLPARWACLPNLERLFLDRNRLTGGLPPSWNTMQSVQYL